MPKGHPQARKGRPHPQAHPPATRRLPKETTRAAGMPNMKTGATKETPWDPHGPPSSVCVSLDRPPVIFCERRFRIVYKHSLEAIIDSTIPLALRPCDLTLG